MSKQKRGWCIVSPVIIGLPCLWTTQDTPDSPIMPEVHTSEEHARREIVDSYIGHLQQYLDGDRAWEDTDLNGPDEYIAQIMIDDKDNLLVWEEGKNLIAMTLTQWRETL